MPENTVYVGRPGTWGNRWKIGVHSNHYGRKIETHAEAVERYETMLKESPHMAETVRLSLRGKNLACWCPMDKPCHADVLLRVANA